MEIGTCNVASDITYVQARLFWASSIFLFLVLPGPFPAHTIYTFCHYQVNFLVKGRAILRASSVMYPFLQPHDHSAKLSFVKFRLLFYTLSFILWLLHPQHHGHQWLLGIPATSI